MKPHSAFTLIELLIVVAIIGILAAIAVPNFLNAQLRAKIGRVLADHRTLRDAEVMYRMDNGTYHIHAHTTNQHAPLTTPVAYLNSWPIDPFQEKLPEEARQMGPYAKRTIHWEPFMSFNLSRAEGYIADYPGATGWNVSAGPGSGGAGDYDVSNGLRSGGNIKTNVPGDPRGDYVWWKP